MGNRISNLININGITSNLEIKIEDAVFNAGEYIKTIKFKKPFKNKCLGIICVDDASANLETISHQYIVVTDSSTITKDGFTALSLGKNNVYAFTYFAFGY